jgi:hypothetical protein
MLAWKVEPWAATVPLAHAGAATEAAAAGDEAAEAGDEAAAGALEAAAGVDAAAALAGAAEVAAALGVELDELLLFVPHAVAPMASSPVAASRPAKVRVVLTR